MLNCEINMTPGMGTITLNVIQIKEEDQLANTFPLLPSRGKRVDTLNALSSQKKKRKRLLS